MFTWQNLADRITLFGVWGSLLHRLTPEQMAAFERLEADGLAKRKYTGLAGHMGRARIRQASITEEMGND